MAISLLATVALLVWAGVCLRKGKAERATAAGALAMAAVTGAGLVAEQLGVAFWVEGGAAMPWIALCGGYAVGTATASRLSGSHPARLAAIIGSLFTVVLGALFYRYELSVAEEIVKNASPHDAQIILEGTRAEVAKLVQLGGALAVLALAILFTPAKRRRSHRRVVNDLPDTVSTHEDHHRVAGRRGLVGVLQRPLRGD